MVLRKVGCQYFLLFIILFFDCSTFAAVQAQKEITVLGAHYFLSVGKNKNKLPYFTIENGDIQKNITVVMGEDIQDAFSYHSSISFKEVERNQQRKIFAVVAASSGASDTEFEVNMVEFTGTSAYILTPSAWHLMSEDGFFVRKMNKLPELTIVKWNFIFASDESRADPHRYRI